MEFKHRESWNLSYSSETIILDPHCHLHYSGRLYEICYTISQCLFAAGGTKSKHHPVTRDTLEGFYRDLTLWYDSLIGCLKVDRIKSPHTLSLQ